MTVEIRTALLPDPEIERLKETRVAVSARRRAVLERLNIKLPGLNLDEHLAALAADLAGAPRKEP